MPSLVPQSSPSFQPSQPENEAEETLEVFVLWEQVMESIRTKILSGLDIEAIRKYCTTEQTKENLLALGKIFEVLGKYAGVLLFQKSYGGLIKDYVSLFSESASASPTQLDTGSPRVEEIHNSVVI